MLYRDTGYFSLSSIIYLLSDMFYTALVLLCSTIYEVPTCTSFRFVESCSKSILSSLLCLVSLTANVSIPLLGFPSGVLLEALAVPCSHEGRLGIFPLVSFCISLGAEDLLDMIKRIWFPLARSQYTYCRC